MGNENSKIKDSSKITQDGKNGELNGQAVDIASNGLDIDVSSQLPNQLNGKATVLNSDLVMQSNSQHLETEDVPEKLAVNPQKEDVKHDEKMQLFEKIFKRKADLEAPADTESVAENHKNITNESSLLADETQLDTANQKQEALTEVKSGSPDQTDNANSTSAQEETNSEESPVMNFFKNLMTPTKTSKKETPEVSKDQRQRESQSATTTTVAQVSDPPAASKGMLIPPPPPPELPKVEVKAEQSSKSAKPTTSKETTKTVAKSTESSKGKSTKDVLSKFFRPKTNKETQLQEVEAEVIPIVEKQETPDDVQQAVIEVEAEEPQQTPEEATLMVVEEKMTVEAPQPEVENEVNPAKAGTLEATARPEPPPPVHEEKKTPSKSSFLSFLKPKASDPKKASPAPAKPADATSAVKAKEEPKATVKSVEVVIDDKVASVATKAGDSARKPEKRNSIQLFLKHLGQKRHSTDAGVQTEPVNVATAAK
ncbi:breast carcinoma-amplified sequence 1 isoform X2 [Corythoichthys intestinalis]|uniref:breast carcinoma-amplified sequence 1 isoform X2 n=1 Tax=Corythoichthys intestinalis TaxID=161448 RepID=UPI0025A68073|nr:breast carcinoma-amplified sequence 1 isoform X2 [Corythoichthys intestinalis]